MKPESFQKTLIIMMLGLLTVSAFFIRFDNFKQSRLRSIDEMVYFRMAQQVLSQGLPGYQTMPYGKELAARGRPLPEYFFQPLFKHPPLFTFLLTGSLKIFGNNFNAAGYVSILLSALMIPLTYLLGSLVFNRTIGILSAVFLWMDPVSIICSQKVWPDVTIAFCVLLSALLFVWGLKKKSDVFYLLSGIASGLTLNTKYTGVLSILTILFFALFYRRDLFKNKYFLGGLIIPFLLLVPWIFWNMNVFGAQTMPMQAAIHEGTLYFVQMTFLKIGIVLCAGAILLSVVTAIRKVKNKSASIQRENSAATKIESIENVSRYFGYGFIAVFSIVFLNSSIVQSLHFGSLPRGSWSMGYFSGEAPQFYFKQLLEFSFVYFFSFIAIFRYQKNEPAEATVIRLFAIIILIFYMFWGSYQSRYILAGIPFLIILAFSVMAEAYRGISRIDNFLMRPAVKAGFVLLIGYIFLKTVMINMLVSYPNNLCYF